MKCIRCGFCCVSFDVIIVKPEYVDVFDPEDFENMDQAMHKKGGDICPHLKVDNKSKITTCMVHDKPWYKGCPCDTHEVFGDPDKPCRVGEYHLQNGWKITKEVSPDGKECCSCS